MPQHPSRLAVWRVRPLPTSTDDRLTNVGEDRGRPPVGADGGLVACPAGARLGLLLRPPAGDRARHGAVPGRRARPRPPPAAGLLALAGDRRRRTRPHLAL